MASKFDTLFDNFLEAPVDEGLFAIYGAPTISAGKLVLHNTLGAYDGVRTWNQYDLTSSSVQINTAAMISGANNQAFFEIIEGDVAAVGALHEGEYVGSKHIVQCLIDSGTLIIRWAANFNEQYVFPATPTWSTIISTPFNATNHRFLRFRHSAGTTVIVESSSDSVSWSSGVGRGGSANIGITPNSMTMRLLAQSYPPGSTTGAQSWQIEQIGVRRTIGPPFSFGAYVENWPHDTYASKVAPFEAGLATPLKYVNGFIRAGGASPATWIDTAVLNLLPADHIPVLTIEFADTDTMTQNANERRTAVIAGTLDSKLHAEAANAKSYGKEVILRPWHEMNGSWYPWAMDGGDGTSAQFIAAWRHVVDIFKADGATNVKFCFCANCDTSPGVTGPAANTYWPGTSYVDYIAVDGYEGIDYSGASRSFPAIFQHMYDTLAGLHPSAPFLVGETACQTLTYQTAYLNSIYNSTTFPNMVGVLWFQIDARPYGEVDFRLTTAGLATLNSLLSAAPTPDPGGGDPGDGGGGGTPGSSGSGLGTPTASGELLVLDPAEIANERVSFNLTPYVGEAGPDWGDAAIEQFLADVERGQLPIDYRVPNRTVTIPLILTERDEDYDTLRTTLQQKVALWQRQGGWIKRATTTGAVYAEVTGATLKLGGSTMATVYELDVDAILTLTCIPDFFGDEINLPSVTGTGEAVIVYTDRIRGDYPGRCRIIVNENVGNDQRSLIWAWRSRYKSFDPTAQIAYEAEKLTPSAVPVGTSAPLTPVVATDLPGLSGGGAITLQNIALSNVDASQPARYPNWRAVVDTKILADGSELTHEGTYRVWARVNSFRPHASAWPGIRVRLVWTTGDLTRPTENRMAKITAYGEAVTSGVNYTILDLGEINIQRAPIGIHHWTGQIQAMSLGLNMQAFLGATPLSTATAPWLENIQIDKLWVVPVDEGYGVLRSYPPGYSDTDPPHSPAAPLWVETGVDDSVIFAQKALEIRTDGIYRMARSGGVYAPVMEISGDLPRIPVSGLEGRPAELFVLSSQGLMDDRLTDLGGDEISVRVVYRPSYLFVQES